MFQTYMSLSSQTAERILRGKASWIAAVNDSQIVGGKLINLTLYLPLGKITIENSADGSGVNRLNTNRGEVAYTVG